jgi:predicted branched-subunit amino acid permease
MVPAVPGLILFGVAFGTLAAEKGLTLFQSVLMSALVFAGVAQIVSMEIWSPAVTPALIASIVFTTAVVNMRMLLMGASLRPWLADAPAIRVYPSLFVLTDSNWVGAMRYRREGGSDVAFLFGGGFVCWIAFVPSTAAGQVFGSLLRDPRPFGIDLILPLYFVAILAPMFENTRRAIPWAVAGAVAAATQFLIPGFWYIVVGALAGALAEGLFGDD